MTISTPTDAFATAQRFNDFLGTRRGLAERQLFIANYVAATKDNPLTQSEVMLFLKHERSIFARGLPIFVREDTLDLVNEAVEELKSEVLLHQDLPCDEFSLWFEKPLKYTGFYNDPDGNPVDEPWDVWGMGISLSDRIGVNRDTQQEAIVGSDEPITHTMGCTMHLYGMPTWEGADQHHTSAPYFIIDMVGMAFDSDWSTLPAVVKDPVRYMHKFLIALFRLVGQHVELEPEMPSRPVRRAAERAGWKVPEQGYLSVIRLIPSIYGEEGESEEERHLRFRHRVRGHWQQFYCSSRGLPVGDPGAYRLRYVNSYVRGPKDTPLVESNKVGVV